MSHHVSQEGDGLILVSPSDETKQTATIVICHGLGDTAEGFEDFAKVGFLLNQNQVWIVPHNWIFCCRIWRPSYRM